MYGKEYLESLQLLDFPVSDILQLLGPAASTQEKNSQGSAEHMGPGRTNCEDMPNGSESEKSRERDELVKQEMLVQYLQDAYGFSLKITEAIGIISKMMYENTTTGMVYQSPFL